MACLLVCLVCVFTGEFGVCSFSCLLGKFSVLSCPRGKKQQQNGQKEAGI